MPRLVIDPITRIGGHLRIEAAIANGAVGDAWSSGTMFRGMELILRGRDPRDGWQFAQRICGLCGTVHALASVRAVENALAINVPKNARLLRNILLGTQYVQDHVVHFYQLSALDWVDVMAALDADPEATSVLARSMSDWPRSTSTYFKSVRDRLRTFVDSGQLGPFANGYWGHSAYTLPPSLDLLIMAHYLEALDWQRRFMRVHTILGGKSPHPQTFLVGGMALVPEWGGPTRPQSGEHPQQVDRRSPQALSDAGLADIGDLIAEAKRFVEQVYVPDASALIAAYPDWAGIGTGIGNYLSYGEFPEDDSTGPPLLLPRGRIMGRDLTKVETVDQAGVAETVAHSYYTYAPAEDSALKPPWEQGTTQPRYAGPRPPVTTLEGAERYSWLKAPRYLDDRMEVGPLARVLVAYSSGRGDVAAKVDLAGARLGIGREALFGTLGRILARAVEAQVLVDRLDGWLDELIANLATGDLAVADITRWDPGAWPAEAKGVSMGEAPRGAVGHWLRIADRTLSDYQIVDASTWNGSPRDARGRRGALEEALVGTPVVDPARPLEILRVVHSVDPCTACAVHAYRPGDPGSIAVRVITGGPR